MKQKVIILTSLLINSILGFAQIDSTDILAGKKMTMSSNVLNYNPEIYIGLPANFNDTTTYPVVVLLDAEWLFPAFSGITKLMAQMEEIPGCIVVGLTLNNSFKDYGMEFAPKITGVPQSGHADKMLEFFSKELFPFIEKKYNASKERIIWGHSAPGGLFCTYLLLGSDEQFSGIISSSPNLRGNQEYINAENAFEKYYLSFGTNENEMFMGKMRQQVQEFKEKLDKAAPENLKWIYRDNENSNHLTNALKSYIDGIKLYFEMME
jgi:predicted alpha/beta superfamily hydrolase